MIIFKILIFYLKMGKKQQTESVNSKLALVMKSDKAVLEYKQTLKSLRKGY